jgi:hypothetical protein
MSRQTKKKIYLPILFSLFTALIFLCVSAQEETCVEELFTFTEYFDTTDWKAPQSTVSWTGNGEVTLNWLGANFEVTQPSGMGAMIYVTDAGDFDGDGKPDLMGLDIGNNDRLILIRNDYEDLNGDGYDDDGQVFVVDPTEVYDEGFVCGPATITVADYNNDGLLDFFFMKNSQDEFGYTDGSGKAGFVATMFINQGTEFDPDFMEQSRNPNLDFTDPFMDAGIYINWAADHVCSVDIDQDDDMDILVASWDKVFLVRNPGTGPGQFKLKNFEITELNYDQNTGYTDGIGGSTVDAGDFDNDGDVDVIVGSGYHLYDYLVFYENDGSEGFTRQDLFIPDSNATATIATSVADFDQNGFPDIFVATDGVYPGNPEARMWIMRNNGLGDDGEIQFDFECFDECQPLSLFYDVDMSAVVDYDSDGDMDVILADANHSGDYYLIINQLAQVYALYGEAISTNVSPDLNPNTQAITKVRVNALDQYVRGGSSEGLTVTLYASNNGGKDWEFIEKFEGPEIANYSTQNWHYFTHFGSMLKWKAVLTSEEDPMAEFTGASYETPVLTNIELEYTTVERREYSRTSVAAELVDEEDQPIKLIIGGSFYFPGWQGHLRAYDVTNMTSVSSSYSELTTISRPDLEAESGREIVAEGVTIKWDAGALLNELSYLDRTIYTALKDGEGQLSRIAFTTSNVESLKDILNDQQNDHEGLINFIRGEGREWKLGDINHSNPVVVGPPNNDTSIMGSGYSTFVEDWSEREKMLIVGANDGMIHCFRVLTGEEVWGYIPYNLLPKLRNMRPVDEATGERYFLRDVYVDGSSVVEDVFINGEWKTVLICGQGRGKGSAVGQGATGNYYFALDITDIENPLPLWEFTDDHMGETWSVPVVGRISKDGAETWTAFMGSGYDNVEGQGIQGNRFYAVDIASGDDFWYFEVPEVNTQERWSNGENVLCAIPGSPGIIDTDNDGSADRIYIGDLEGRMWKVDASIEFLSSDPWEGELLYEDPNNYPIITKPAAWIQPGSPGAVPRVYFGTGGDDKAPDDATYSFIALIDGEEPEVEWYLGSPDVLLLPEEDGRGDLSTGEKVWADPKIANKVIYFSTLTGNIETVDPCESLAGEGRLYARYIDTLVGTPVGSTAFRTATGQVEFMGLEIKTRAAVTIGETTQAEGIRKKEVYIQEYDSTLQKLEQPAGPMLRIKSWREIFKIIK